MAELTLFLHGQGTSKETAEGHVARIRESTTLEMVPLFYDDLIEDVPLYQFAVPERGNSPEEQEISEATFAALIHGATVMDLDERESTDLLQPLGSGGRSASRFLFQVYRSTVRYLARKKVYAAVRNGLLQQVAAAVKATHGREGSSVDITLVAHSLGTVISLDLLRDPPPYGEYRRFISLGSPLGIISAVPAGYGERLLPLVRRRLDIAWHDYAAEGDRLSTIRISEERGFRANRLKVCTIPGTFPNPHSAFFAEAGAAKVWTTGIQTDPAALALP